MSAVTVSPKYQVVIPLDVRRHMNIKPGQKLVAMAWGDHIVLMPQRPVDEIQAVFKGMVNDFEREKDREF